MIYSSKGFIATIVFAVLILILSIIPSDFKGDQTIFLFKGADKLIHALMYAAFSFLVVNEYLNQSSFKWSSLLIILSIVLAYSILMELVQYFFVDYRSGDWKDVLANLVGIISGSLLILLIRKSKY
jgi:VanZ family protein